MQSKASTPAEYIAQLPEERKSPVKKLRSVIRAALPKGFTEQMNYGMIGYVVPHSIYPAGYHCNPKDPLPFMNLASQKQYIAVYHMAIEANVPLKEWFTREYGRRCGSRLDMGKSCIRLKKPDDIPYGLIGELAGKMTPAEWIALYESVVKRR